MLADPLFEVAHGGFELGVFTFEGGVGCVVDDDVGVDAMTFNEPLTVGAIDAEFGGGSDAVIGEAVTRREPDFATTGARSDQLA